MPSEEDTIGDPTISFRRPERGRSAAAAETVHLLLLLDDNAPPKRYPLRALPVIVGRTPPAGLVLPDNTVSRRHCRLDSQNGHLMLSDLGSTNGTFVNDVRVVNPVILADGVNIAIGAYRLRYHRRNQDETADADAIEAEMYEANRYIASILPKPIAQGPVRAAWFYQPSTRIGGDAFGYQMLNQRDFAFFLLDVSGHGTGAGMHAVAIAQVLRERVLPNVDFRDPAAVIAGLNARFPMDRNNNLFFTIWYGVYDTVRRGLTFAAAGHHPAYLQPANSAAPIPLETEDPVAGLMPDIVFTVARIVVPPDSTLHLFSDGVFEITGADGRERGLDDIVAMLPGIAATGDPSALYDRIRAIARPGQLDDDFSVLVFGFP